MNKNNTLLGMVLLGLAASSFAAKPVALNDQPFSVIQALIFAPTTLSATAQPPMSAMKEVSQHVDFKGTKHIRIQQTYAGYPVWKGDAVIHVPQGSNVTLTTLQHARLASTVSMNGTMYQDIQQDVVNAPANVFSNTQAQAAVSSVVDSYLSKNERAGAITDKKFKPMVYIDDSNKAHLAYYVSFFAKSQKGLLSKPTAIVDAMTKEIYQEWNDLKSQRVVKLEDVKGGGVGGNGHIGKISYDGLPGSYVSLDFQRDSAKKICYLQNAEIKVIDTRNHQVPQFGCEQPDSQHNNLYWNTLNDEANGGYSPNNDAVYSRKIIDDMYRNWMNVPILVEKGKPMMVKMYVHDPEQGQNAYWEDGKMVFGEGDNESYPVVAPSVVAHELSHGFTEQHANLVYTRQSGGLNESFSDMADKAVEYFVYGHNNWEIDPELLKDGGRLLRWMDTPSKDCDGRKPGNQCSIDHMKDYTNHLDVHFSSGIFNRAFTIISSKWNTKKAFEVMAHANMHYWTSNTSFDEAACGVMKSAKDYGYDTETIVDAMNQVGVSTASCH